MADNYLITGYWGEPHVTAENDRGINAAIFGSGRFVLPVGKQFNAEYIGNNTIRVYDGKLLDNGAAAGIPAGEYVDLLVSEAGQGKKRNDLIVFQYAQDASGLIERGTFVVIKGTETSGTASDPELTQQDLLTNKATLDQMALWRVPISGTTISAPVKLFEVAPNVGTVKTTADEANSAASAAQTTADQAKSTASAAQTAASTANTAASAAQTTANAAMPKAGGTFTGQVAAGHSHQSPDTYCLRNARLANTDTNPTTNGQICWTYG